MDPRTPGLRRFPFQRGTPGVPARACTNPTMKRRKMIGASLWECGRKKNIDNWSERKKKALSQSSDCQGKPQLFFLVCSYFYFPLLRFLGCPQGGGVRRKGSECRDAAGTLNLEKLRHAASAGTVITRCQKRRR